LDRWVESTGDKGELPENPSWRSAPELGTQVDGWCTQDMSASRHNGLLRIECPGRQHSIVKSFVTESGALRFDFRARSDRIRPARLFWGTIDNVVYRPGPFAPIEFVADGEWREYRIAFHVAGFLALLGIDLGTGPGVIEFEWIRLMRGVGDRVSLLKQWTFKT
jgi:hypothetical protein